MKSAQNIVIYKQIYHNQLCFNNDIRISGKGFYIDTWFKAGVHSISDLRKQQQYIKLHSLKKNTYMRTLLHITAL